MNRAETIAKSGGFTALELLVVLAIVATLLALAIPAYRGYVHRAERVEAVRSLLAMAACQERVRAETGFFDTGRCLPESPGETYRFRIEPRDVGQSLVFTVFAAPVRPLAGDRCGILSLDNAGTRGTSGDPGWTNSCWSGR